MILNALDLRHRVAREVMRPRQEIAAFNTGATMADCLALAEKTRYSRFPGLRGRRSGQDARRRSHQGPLRAARPGADGGGFAAGGASVDLCAGNGAAGKTAAVVSRTAAAFCRHRGRIRRHARHRHAGKRAGGARRPDSGRIRRGEAAIDPRGENAWEVAGTLPLHELEKIIGAVPHDESVATASGWVTQELGGFPKAGDTLTVGACELRVEEMDGPRVARLKIMKRDEPQSGRFSNFFTTARRGSQKPP